MSAKGYTSGTWSGLPQFACERCSYSVADKDAEKAEGVMRRHIARRHLGVPADAVLSDEGDEPSEEEGEEVTLDFASDAGAEAFIAVDEDRREQVAQHLQRREPSGATGYTVADVREAVAAVTTEE